MNSLRKELGKLWAIESYMSELEGLGQPSSGGRNSFHSLPDTCHLDSAYTSHGRESLLEARSVALVDNLDFLLSSFSGTFHP